MDLPRCFQAEKDPERKSNTFGSERPPVTPFEVLRSALKQRMVTFHRPNYGNLGRVETS